tara:strand:+ start:10522 stop:11769 length:1248 start_codon:yes stop_codon:yes gene_type:complete
MSSETSNTSEPKLDLAKWAKLPNQLILGGGILLLIGLLFPGWRDQFYYSYLTGFMFFLSLTLGSLFLVLLHHLFDAYWLVPVRRFLEHIACLAPTMGLLFLPILVFSSKIYPWMSIDPNTDHALHVKVALFNKPAFWITSILLFAIWRWLSNSLRKHSLAQDETGAASHTHALRKLAAPGVIIFAFTLTLGVIFWMKSLEHQWFSTMYGVYYFAASVWVTLATTYVLTAILQRTGHLAPVVTNNTYKDTGTLFFAFTVFYAYIHFSQYFLIWNAAIPEETFWYVKRENGIWKSLGYLIIFGHFFVPFLAMLRIDVKKSLTIMGPLAIWAWLMHYADMTYNIKPVLDPKGDGISLSGFVQSAAALAFMGGVLSKGFLKSFITHPPFPQKDPRIAEAMGVYVELESEAANKTKSADA